MKKLEEGEGRGGEEVGGGEGGGKDGGGEKGGKEEKMKGRRCMEGKKLEREKGDVGLERGRSIMGEGKK